MHSEYRNYFPAVSSETLHNLGKKGLHKSLRQAVRLLFAQLAVSWRDLSLYSVLSVLKERCHLLGFLQKSCSGLYSGLHTDITGQNKYSLSLFVHCHFVLIDVDSHKSKLLVTVVIASSS